MGLYKIDNENVAQRVKSEDIDYESLFEDWLENTPSLLFDDDSLETVLWIGRQATATVGNGVKYPDLIGIDYDGDLVIVELKKGRTPRDVIAQILEYASWGHSLGYEDLNSMFLQYAEEPTQSLLERYADQFDIEDLKEDHFNKRQKLFIVAEKIDSGVEQVSKYLCDVYKMNINHLEYEVMKTPQKECIVSVKKSFGYVKPIILSQDGTTERWGGDKIGDIVYSAVKSHVGKSGKTFELKEIVDLVSKEHPTMRRDTIRCRITADCVNHTSRRHYPSGQKDHYYRIEKGKFRLYDPATDGKWNREGRKTN